MAPEATWKKYILTFRTPARTSRGTLHRRSIWVVRVTDAGDSGQTGYGECSPLPGLSPDDRPDFEKMLEKACAQVSTGSFSPQDIPTTFPSIRFGLETALLDLQREGRQLWYPSLFTEGKRAIPINGLIWMADKASMRRQIIRKLEEGYRVIKLKIGGLAFEQELSLLQFIRREFRTDYPEIRLDANGAFTPEEAPEKLKKLADYDIHSIEQPLRPGQWLEMASLCRTSPIPIALDEELIAPRDGTEKEKLLNTIRPAYLILKPTLLGGFAACEEWIALAKNAGTGWWITSALESNLGLNAIAQWTYTLNNPLPQGLGTGQLYASNFDSPLFIRQGHLRYDPGHKTTIRLT